MAKTMNSPRDEEEPESFQFTSVQSGDKSRDTNSLSNSIWGISRSSSDRIDATSQMNQNKDRISSGQSSVHQVVSEQEFFRICSNKQPRLPEVNSKFHEDGIQQSKTTSSKRGTYVSNAW
jgi:hypothetical protein